MAFMHSTRRSGRLALALMIPYLWVAAPARAEAPRPTWTNSRFAGEPDPPPPYVAVPAFPKLKFENPVALAGMQGTDRLFVVELRGRVVSFPNNPDADAVDVTLDLRKKHPDVTNIYGFAFHPKFALNRQVFLCYTVRDGRPDGTRVARFTMTAADPPKIDADSEQILISWLAGGHNGGCLAFGHDGMLYISTGDGAGPSPPDTLNTGQDLSDLLSSILRIDVDHADADRPYRVPPDNPFVDTPGARPEIWAYGFRNPWRMSVDRKNGDLWVGDVGWELWELVDRVVRGGNYGWSVVEGHQPVHPEGRRGPTPILPPTVEHPHSEAASITGGYVYHGTRLPQLEGVYIYGDYQSGKVWGLRFDGQRVTEQKVLAETPISLASFGEDASGELYLLDHERSRQVYRLAVNDAAARANRTFPRRLSETGLFASTRDLTPAPGVIPYAINAPLWSDHATAERWLAIPGDGRIAFGERGEGKLPDGSVLARTVSIERRRGDAASKTRLETQVLHREGGSWRPYTYVWNADQTDADLAPADGTHQVFRIEDPQAPGGYRTQNHRVHSRAECSLCHNPWVESKTTIFGRQSASPLAFSTEQLNRTFARDGREFNQLRAFEEAGILAAPLKASPDDLPSFADPYDPSADVERRARAYLHVNCSHCHQFNAGGAATIFLTADLARDKMQTIDAKPTQGTFGIADARVVRPGEPEGSLMFYRISKLGGGRMPRIGSNLVDERAVDLIGRWISQLPRPEGSGPASLLTPDDEAALKVVGREQASSSDRGTAVRQLITSTRGALALMRAIDRGDLRGDARREAVALAAAHPLAEVRDLFERFLPESERIARLGDAVDPKVILSHPGNAARGRAIFLDHPAAQCKSCHKLDGVGEPIGPDLAKIGAKYPKPELLAQILEPSRVIDPQFATYVVETKAGLVHTGLLVEKTPKEVVLKNAQNQTTRIPTSEVDHMLPQARSLMPELLLRDLTAQQAADLIEFLSTLK